MRYDTSSPSIRLQSLNLILQVLMRMEEIAVDVSPPLIGHFKRNLCTVIVAYSSSDRLFVWLEQNIKPVLHY